MAKSKTIFLDIDGCVFKHFGKGPCDQFTGGATLPGVREAFDQWERAGHRVVLTTSRPECCRAELQCSLREHGLFWHALVMGLPSGERVVINDQKAEAGEPSARAIVLRRNDGLAEAIEQLREDRNARTAEDVL